jgi:hypothetical protein
MGDGNMSSGPFGCDSLLACPLVWLGVLWILAIAALGVICVKKWPKPIHLLLLITVVGGLAISVLIPEPSMAPTPRIVTKRRLDQLGIPLVMYQQDNDGHLPPTLGHLFSSVGEGGAFVTGSSGTPEPSSREDVDRGQCDFLYFGAGLVDSADTTDVVVATTKPRTFMEEGYLCTLHCAGYVQTHTVIPQDVREVWNKHGFAVPESPE